MALSTRHALESPLPHSTVPNACVLGAAQAYRIHASTDTRFLPGRAGFEGSRRSEADADGGLVPKPIKTLMLGGVGLVLVGISVGESGENTWGKLIVAVGALLYVIGRLFVWSLDWHPTRSTSIAALALENEWLQEESRHLHSAGLGDLAVSAAWVLRPERGRRRHQGQHARRALNALERAARFRAQRGVLERQAQRVNPAGWLVV